MIETPNPSAPRPTWRSVAPWTLAGLALLLAVDPVAAVIREHSSTVDRWSVEVVDSLPHDPSAITQGLELADDVFYHSTGGYGVSTIRAESATTGTVLASRELPGSQYGEGVTVVGDRLWQLTWREGRALLRDRDTLAVVDEAAYDGEGWGLCHDRDRDVLVMSDGSATLTLRDPRTFATVSTVDVMLDGAALPELNELECVNGSVWANVRGSDRIVRVDVDSGTVDALADVDGLLSPVEREDAGDLNGIAWAGGDRFWLTGKAWPSRFLVRLSGP